MASSFPMIAVIGLPMENTIGTSGLDNMFATYILRSEKDSSYYIGSTKDLESRVIRHNKGYSRYAKAKQLWRLVYKEEYVTLSDLSEAKIREYYLKSLKSKIVIEKLIKKGPIV